MQLKASAPGSLMLLGEYAVLDGKHAVVCAINKRITITLKPRNDESIHIYSTLHGEYSCDLNNFIVEKPFHFVLGVIKHFQGRIKRGCDLYIESEFSDQIGLGSSAAVTVATMAAIIKWMNIRIVLIDLIRQGRNVVRQIQGVGSGADIAASVFGGVVGYQAQPLSAEKLANTPPLCALYAGFKTPTVDAIKYVQNHFAQHTAILRNIHNSIGQCALDALQAIRKEDWQKLGSIMNIQQGMMESLGVSNTILHAMIDDLRKQPDIKGAKISGSGLGDCVIGLGELADNYQFVSSHPGVQRIPIEITSQGVSCEKI